MDHTTLYYFTLNPRQDITLDLFEAEKYESAIIVQQLVGNLIYYSNFGRYEPRIAESWFREDDRTWVFNLGPDFRCEDGEIIDAISFKESLERTLHIYSKMGDVPVLSPLLS